MIRYVTHTRKDTDRDIIALCDRGAAWSPVSKAQAISDINSRVHEYLVSLPLMAPVHIIVVRRNDGTQYLRTNPDLTRRNNLEDLPDC